MKTKEMLLFSIECSCGHVMCGQCNYDGHLPLPCNLLIIWNDYYNDDDYNKLYDNL